MASRELTLGIVLALVGAVTLVYRYKGQNGRLVQIIRRDGGVHYLSLLGWSCQHPRMFHVIHNSQHATNSPQDGHRHHLDSYSHVGMLQWTP